MSRPQTASGFLLVVLCVLLWAVQPHAQTAERRVALVIGNGAYQNLPSLTNPVNDAGLIARTLQGLGFELVGGGPLSDLDKPGFDRAVQAFGTALQNADVGLFYYAGHGLQVQGTNWLVPVGANPAGAQDVDFQMVDAALVLKQMQYARTRLNVVILDACRNNPFSGRGLRSSGGGLAEMRAPEGTMIAYSTQPGNVAADGAGPNSPFSQALAATLVEPGLDVFRLFNRVGLAVKRATDGVQQPWVSSSPIEGDFVFSQRPGSAPGVAAATVPPLPPAALPPAAPPPRPAQQAMLFPLPRPPPQERVAGFGRGPSLFLASVRALNPVGHALDVGFSTYAGQYDLNRGPTGRERSVRLPNVFGTQELEALAALRATLESGADLTNAAGFAELAEPLFPVPLPASPAPIAVAAVRFLDAAQALQQRLADAKPYYDQENYRDDGYARAKSLHPGLVSGFRDMLLARALLHQSAAALVPNERETFLNSVDPSRRAMSSLVLQAEAQGRRVLSVIVSGWDTGKGPRGIDQTRLKTEIDLFERSLTELKSNQPADSSVPGISVDQRAMRMGFYLERADTLLKAARFVSRALRSGDKLEYPYFGFRDGSEQDIYSRFNTMIGSGNRLTD